MKSMTGYGRAKYNEQDILLEIEIKSVNGRNLDLKVISPRELSFFEIEVRRRISRALHRGYIEVKINYQDHREPDIKLDKSRFTKYYHVIKEALELVDSEQSVPLEYLLAEPNMIQPGASLSEDSVLTKALNLTLDKAIAEVISSMETEGEQIRRVLQASAISMYKAIEAIEAEIAPFKEELLARLTQRINELLKNINLDNLEQRLVQETAIYVDKYDVQEEISRLRHHLEKLEATLKIDADDEIGKRLNFIIQEMHREANTLGSKFSTTRTFSQIISLKEEIEKCREISLNVT